MSDVERLIDSIRMAIEHTTPGTREWCRAYDDGLVDRILARDERGSVIAEGVYPEDVRYLVSVCPANMEILLGYIERRENEEAAEIDSLGRRVEELEDENSQLEDECSDLESQLETASRDLEVAEDELADAKSEMKRLNYELGERDVKIAGLLGALAEAERRIVALMEAQA